MALQLSRKAAEKYQEELMERTVCRVLNSLRSSSRSQEPLIRILENFFCDDDDAYAADPPHGNTTLAIEFVVFILVLLKKYI